LVTIHQLGQVILGVAVAVVVVMVAPFHRLWPWKGLGHYGVSDLDSLSKTCFDLRFYWWAILGSNL